MSNLNPNPDTAVFQCFDGYTTTRVMLSGARSNSSMIGGVFCWTGQGVVDLIFTFTVLALFVTYTALSLSLSLSLSLQQLKQAFSKFLGFFHMPASFVELWCVSPQWVYISNYYISITSKISRLNFTWLQIPTHTKKKNGYRFPSIMCSRVYQYYWTTLIK